MKIVPQYPGRSVGSTTLALAQKSPGFIDTHPLYSIRKPIADNNDAASIKIVLELSYPGMSFGSTPLALTHLYSPLVPHQETDD